MSPPTLDNPFRESRLNASQDYRPEWDVPSLNAKITQVLAKEIRQAKGRDKPDPGQLVPVLLSAPGYGKTHLFGRVSHVLGDEMFFVYVPAFEDVSRPLEHIRRHVVESLFRPRAGRASVLAEGLARLCRLSLIEYVSQFPPSVLAKHPTLQQELQDGVSKSLEMVAAVKEVIPFQKLAASIADRNPALPHGVMKAIALGWSPAANQVRHWLRGEPLPDNEVKALALPTDPPSPLAVLQGVAAILQYRVPMVLCCDQMEMVLQASPDGVRQVTAELMEILHQVPNQVLILSCLEGEWVAFRDRMFAAFGQRVRNPPLKLDDLQKDQAVELVANRLKTWPGRQHGQSATWPFDEPALLGYVQRKQPTPRILIQRCGSLFEPWLESNRQKDLIINGDGDGDLTTLFRQRWTQELEAIRQDPSCKPGDYPEDRLYRAVKEALTLAREAGQVMGGVRIKNLQEDVIRQAGSNKRYSLKVDLTAGGQNSTVIVPVTTLNSGALFRFYYRDLQTALAADSAAGALVVHRWSEFQMGTTTQAQFDEDLAKGKVRVFALEENQATFERLECLLRFLDDAVTKQLQLAGLTLSFKDCQDLLLKTALLDNLDLFKALAGWHKQPAAVPVAAAKPPPGKAPVPSGVPAAGPVGTTPAPAKAPAPLPPTPAPVPAVAPTASVKAAPSADGLKPSAPTFHAWCKDRLDLLCKKLALWGLPVTPVEPDPLEIGPSFARLKVLPASVKATFKKICDKAVDLRIHLGLDVPPLIDSQAGYISIDVQLPKRRTVALAEIQSAAPPAKGGELTFPVGLDVAGNAHWLNLADTSDCHLLVAGTTGSGKSEFLRAMVAALACRLSYEQLQFIFIDPKYVTFNLGGQESPYVHGKIAHEAADALELLQWSLDETKRRYELLAHQKLTNVDQLEDVSLVPRIVVVIDEFANLMEEKKTKAVLTALLKQIGSMSRAAGIHLVLATQRPDKDVVTPLLRDNLPGRIALRVMKEASSELILNSPNAAYLLGRGDLLWQRGAGLLRLQSPFVTQGELEKCLKV